MYHQTMTQPLDFNIERNATLSLNEQIFRRIRDAIRDSRLPPGSRLPSWRDLAAQLGVSRGTVRIAYERLLDAQFLVSSGPAGTHVSDYPPATIKPQTDVVEEPLAGLFLNFSASPGIFQMGVSSLESFPFKLWSRIMVRAARAEAAAPTSYPDPRGEPELRRVIAAYLAISRGISCSHSQVFVTVGYVGAIGLILRALGVEGQTAWIEEPGYPVLRTALQIAGVRPLPVLVDAEGIDVSDGIAKARNAALAVVTPGQQAPLGVTMSAQRRMNLLNWATKHDAWIIEDDYLSELQLQGRAAPALASLDRDGRVVHVGTFSKTISPTLRLGFVVVPSGLIRRFGDVAASLAPAPGGVVQRAVSEFITEGHYMRHLRRMKRVYLSQQCAVRTCFGDSPLMEAMAGMGVLINLPDGSNDREIVRQARFFGISPDPLSAWYTENQGNRAGLLLGITNVGGTSIKLHSDRLKGLIEKFS